MKYHSAEIKLKEPLTHQNHTRALLSHREEPIMLFSEKNGWNIERPVSHIFSHTTCLDLQRRHGSIGRAFRKKWGRGRRGRVVKGYEHH